MTRKLISNIILTTYIVNLFAINLFAKEDERKTFVITAYYSPLPDQTFYLRGNYEADIRLNGRGTNGASGKEVYPGMLAAPKTYAFGTRISLDGIGVGIVDDRGGAIVSSGSRNYDCDRLDIWMGYGEEGLKRALTWGKRRISGKVQHDSDSPSTISLDKFKIGYVNVKKLQNSYVGKEDDKEMFILQAKQYETDIFSYSITKNSGQDSIRKLQQVMKDLGYYAGEQDGIYNKKLTDAIYRFQSDNKLVKSPTEIGAGFFGPKTRSTLKAVYAGFVKEQIRKMEEEQKAREELEKREKEFKIKKEKIRDFILGFGNPKLNEIGSHVRALQNTLKKFGYFKEKDTAIFGKKTKDSLIRYQIDRKIIKDDLDPDAGKIGDKTIRTMIDDLIILSDET